MPIYNINDYRKEIADLFLETLKRNEEIPWYKGWNDNSVPLSGQTGREYKGLNRFYLMLVKNNNGFKDRRWYTFNSISSLNGEFVAKYERIHGEKPPWEKQIHIAKGQKSIARISDVFYTDNRYLSSNGRPKRISTSEAIKIYKDNPEIFEKHISKHIRYVPVFNGDQVLNLQPEIIKLNPFKKSDVVNILSDKMGVPILHDGGGRAYYDSSEDKIHLPLEGEFKTQGDLNATALHELVHATGHPSRLNRITGGIITEEGYAFEELIAEIGSAMMGLYADDTINDAIRANHMSYVKSWIASIENDSNVLIKAIGEATKASEYLDAFIEPELSIEMRERDKQGEEKAELKQREEVVNKEIARDENKHSNNVEKVNITNAQVITIENASDFQKLLNDKNEIGSNKYFYQDKEKISHTLMIEHDQIRHGQFYNPLFAKALLNEGNSLKWEEAGLTYFDFKRADLAWSKGTNQNVAMNHFILAPYGIVKGQNSDGLKSINKMSIAGNSPFDLIQNLYNMADNNDFSLIEIKDGNNSLSLSLDKKAYLENLPSLDIALNNRLLYSDTKPYFSIPYQVSREVDNETISDSYTIVSPYYAFDYCISSGIFAGSTIKPEIKDASNKGDVSVAEESGNGYFDPYKGDIDFRSLPDEHEVLVNLAKDRGKTTVVVNLFGGPGMGKTEVAKSLTNVLLTSGFTAYYVPEYTKEIAMQDKNNTLLDGSLESQSIILKQQLSRIDNYLGRVDFIVTDSPLISNLAYLKQADKEYENTVIKLHNQFNNFNIALKRNQIDAKYSQQNRIHDLRGAREIDKKISQILEENKIYAGHFKYDNSFNDKAFSAISNYLSVKQKEEYRIKKALNDLTHEVSNQSKRPLYKNEEKHLLRNAIKIEDYARDVLNFKVRRAGRNNVLSTVEHDSLMIYQKTNTFYRFSSRVGGDIFDFIEEFDHRVNTLPEAEKFKESYKLAKEYYKTYNPNMDFTFESDSLSEDDRFILPAKSGNKEYKQARAYLISERGIDSKVVSEWISRDLLYQDKFGNAIFVGYDASGEPRYAHSRNTTPKNRVMHDVRNSFKNNGIVFYNEDYHDLFVCEAAIDMMSLQTIQGKDKYLSASYISIQGVSNTEAVRNFLKTYDTSSLEKIHICLDNDLAGNNATDSIVKMLASKTDNIIGINGNQISIDTITVVDERPKEVKDWNEELFNLNPQKQHNISNSFSIAIKQADKIEVRQNKHFDSEGRIIGELNPSSYDLLFAKELKEGENLDVMDFENYIVKHPDFDNIANTIVVVKRGDNIKGFSYDTKGDSLSKRFVHADWYATSYNKYLLENDLQSKKAMNTFNQDEGIKTMNPLSVGSKINFYSPT